MSESFKSRAPIWRRVVFHPLWWLLIGVLLTQKLRDTFYPFSSVEMYSRLDADATVISLEDPDGKPLGTLQTVGLTSAKVGKMFHSAVRDVCSRTGSKISKAKPGDLEMAADQVFETLLPLSRQANRTPLPPGTRMVRTTLELKNDTIQQTQQTVGTLDADAKGGQP